VTFIKIYDIILKNGFLGGKKGSHFIITYFLIIVNGSDVEERIKCIGVAGPPHNRYLPQF
jgi:hypothetical protein